MDKLYILFELLRFMHSLKMIIPKEFMRKTIFDVCARVLQEYTRSSAKVGKFAKFNTYCKLSRKFED